MPIVPVLDSSIAYTDAGTGERAVVFLHGNPTSSHLWRNVIPGIADLGRCVAPDLIGMGSSGKPELAYRFADHARYLDAWFDALALTDVVLVGHDWGGALGLDWAARHPDRVRGVALMETFLRPMTWAEYPATAAAPFQRMRTPGVGETMVLEENWFIDTRLRSTPGLSPADFAVYQQPYPTPASRVPLLQWPREIPLDGEPADVAERFTDYGKWLVSTPEVPKLLLTIDGGGLVSPAILDWCRAVVAGIEIEGVGAAGHNVPEEKPEVVGRAVASWLRRKGLVG